MDKEESRKLITALDYRLQDVGSVVRANRDKVGPVPEIALRELGKRLKAFKDMADVQKGIPKRKEWIGVLIESTAESVMGYVAEKLKDGKIKFKQDLDRFFKTKKDPSLFQYSVITGGVGVMIGGGMKFTRLARGYLGERRAVKEQIQARTASRRRAITDAAMSAENEKARLERELKKERAKIAKERGKEAARLEKERAAQKARAEEAKKRERAEQEARKRAEQKARVKPSGARQKKPKPVFQDFEDVFTE